MNIEKIHDMMDNTIYGVPTAKAAIDIACFDIVGKTLNHTCISINWGTLP